MVLTVEAGVVIEWWRWNDELVSFGACCGWRCGARPPGGGISERAMGCGGEEEALRGSSVGGGKGNSIAP
jgi:hypothetical protein